MTRLYWKHKPVGVKVYEVATKGCFHIMHPFYTAEDALYMCIAHEGRLLAVRSVEPYTPGVVFCRTVDVTVEDWAKPMLLQELLLN